MTSTKLNIDVSAATISNAGVVIGKLHVQMRGQAPFPHEGWTDFVVVVLREWAEALARLLGGEHGPIEVRFMEGPYLVELRNRSERAWHLRLVEAGLHRRVRQEDDVEIGTLVGSVVGACQEVLALCRSRSWWSQDAEALDRSARRLSVGRTL